MSWPPTGNKTVYRRSPDRGKTILSCDKIWLEPEKILWIILAGVVVNNPTVLMDYARASKEEVSSGAKRTPFFLTKHWDFRIIGLSGGMGSYFFH